MSYVFYAVLLFPSVIRSDLFSWKLNHKEELKPRVFHFFFFWKIDNTEIIFIFLNSRRTFDDMLLFCFTVKWAGKIEKEEKVSARFLVPIEQKSCFCIAPWTQTQITLPTPTRMKTKSGGVSCGVGSPFAMSGNSHRHSLITNCCGDLPIRRDCCTDSWGMSARICRAPSGCLVTSSCSACQWPGVTLCQPFSPQDPWERVGLPESCCRHQPREIVWSWAQSLQT